MKPVRFALVSLGCSKNQVDSEIMINALEKRGYLYTHDTDEADLLVVNTCGFITPAKEQSIGVILELGARRPDAALIMAGCLTQRYREALERQMPEVDGFLGTGDPEGIVAVAERALAARGRATPAAGRRPASDAGGGGPTPITGGRGSEAAAGVRAPRTTFPRRGRLLSFPRSAYIKVAEGCDNRCSYCAIPLIRGRLRSRSVEEVAAEHRELLARGVFEFNLVAQDLGSFGLDRGRFELPRLLRELLRVEGEFWIRLLYIHPDRFHEEVLEIMREDGRLVPYLDLPFQHASAGILRAMGRRGDGEGYLALLDRIRTAVPDAVIRSTFLVGFPAEGPEEFEELLRFQRRAELDWLGVFCYSPEEGTAAERFPLTVAAKEAHRRMRVLE